MAVVHERVLVDTSALYAIHSDSDLFHRRAATTLEQLVDTEQELWATSYTLVETIALLDRRLGFEVVSVFARWCESNLNVLWIDSRMHSEALDRFMALEGRGLSFVDWTIAVASREMGATVFTFDRDFANEALPIVPH